MNSELERRAGPERVRTGKRRIDTLMVERGLAESRQQARALLMAGEVKAGGEPVTKPGTPVDSRVAIEVAQPPPYVGRGGTKLAHALDELGLDVAGSVALDVGASTGGFTDCLLQRRATKVYAVDVGYGQLHQRLRDDSRVVLRERLNARYPFDLPERVDLATVDVSFISLALVLPSVAAHVKRNGSVIPLVKPQFEAERRRVGRGGIVRDPKVHAAVLARIIVWAVGHGLHVRGLTRSPILGDAGNQEFFLWLAT